MKNCSKGNSSRSPILNCMALFFFFSFVCVQTHLVSLLFCRDFVLNSFLEDRVGHLWKKNPLIEDQVFPHHCFFPMASTFWESYPITSQV